MALGDRAVETTTTTGTGTVDLAGASTGYQTLVAALTDSEGGSGPWTDVPYLIIQSDANGDPVDVERGRGTVTDAATDTLTRPSGEVTFSTNSNALVSFSSGTKTVLISPMPNDFDASQTVELYLAADDSIAAGAVEELTMTVSTGGDPYSLFASNQATAPFDGYATILMSLVCVTSDEFTMSATINGTHIQDFSDAESGAAAGTGPVGVPLKRSVSKDDTIKIYAHNLETSLASTAMGDAAGNETLATIIFTRS